MNLENSTEEYIDAIYYYKMYFSEAGLKTNKEVMYVLGNSNYRTLKVNVLKENIRMRVKGFGWTQWDHAWTKGNHK